MGKRGPKTTMSAEQLATIEKMRSEGKTQTQIARRIGMSTGAVSWYCLRHAIEGPQKTRVWSGIRGPTVVRRGNHVIRRYTPDEDAKIIEMELAGARVAQIAKVLGRKNNSVAGRLATLARREEISCQE